MKAKLQVALDFADEGKALSVARKVRPYAEIIEAGTPLIKACGEKTIIKKLKKACGKRKIFADLKTMDTGFFEADVARKHGADYVTVLGVADDATVRGAIEAAGKENVVVDLIGCKDPAGRIRELAAAGAVNFEVHTGIDEQNRGMSPFAALERASEMPGIRIWVAGGIRLETVARVMAFRPFAVVVGGAITKAKDPGKEAMLIKKRMDEC